MRRLPVAVIAVASIGAAAVWTRPPTALPSLAQVQELLPPTAAIRGLVRLEMNGKPPLEAAGVAVVPSYPGAVENTYIEFVVAYDEWRRRPVRIYARPLPGPIPLTPDAVSFGRGREAAVFSTLRDDGTRVSQVVGMVGPRARVLDDAAAARLLAGLPPAPAGVTWQYRTHSGIISARTFHVAVKPRQPVRLALSSGGPTPIIIPDARLDIVEQGYRARQPGTYTIRILLPSAPDQGTTLTILVEN